MNSQHCASLFVFGDNLWENALKADILQKQLHIYKAVVKQSAGVK